MKYYKQIDNFDLENLLYIEKILEEEDPVGNCITMRWMFVRENPVSKLLNVNNVVTGSSVPLREKYLLSTDFF